jgi:hypothetical protein
MTRCELEPEEMSRVVEENEELRRQLMDTRYKLALDENTELRRSLKLHQDMLKEKQDTPMVRLERQYCG